MELLGDGTCITTKQNSHNGWETASADKVKQVLLHMLWKGKF